MDHNQLGPQALQQLLSAGIESGAFAECELGTRRQIQAFALGPTKATRVAKAAGYVASTYLITFPASARISGLVIKVIPLCAERLIADCVQERALLHEIYHESCSCTLPAQLAEFELGELRIFVSQLLPGVSATKIIVDTAEARGIAQSIRDIQRALPQTITGAALIREALQAERPYYTRKVRKFLRDFRGLELTAEEVAFLEPLERVRKSAPALVSDRSPANFVLHEGKVGAFDFGLVLAGVPHEDWSWFIDDPRLNSSLCRQELLEVFLEDEVSRAVSRGCFHLSAIFVCLKQYSLMYALDRHSVAEHYLSRAAESAEALSLPSAKRLLQKITDSPPAGVRDLKAGGPH